MNLLSYEVSQNMLALLEVTSRKNENVPLNASLGRILYTDIVAVHNDPQFPTASMDGYALKHADLKLDSIEVLGFNPAGNNETRIVTQGTCIKTFTGSKMPEGADTLIQIENVNAIENTITIETSVPFASWVRPIGESYKSGDILIKKGTKIGFAEIGVMAGLNTVMVKVCIKPKVAVIATGNEILDLGEASDNPAQIRSSNNYTLAALFEQAGADVIQLGTVGDDKDSILQTFENALLCADILVSTGGVSVGDYDFVKDLIPRLGAEVIFKGVAIKPGRHLMLAQHEDKFILALPGFAYSSTVTALLYVLPLICKMLAKEKAYTIIEAKLSENFNKKSHFTEFTACNIVLEDGEYLVNFKGKKDGSSAILTNLLDSSALMISAQEDNNLEAGTYVNVILLENF